MKKTKVSVLPYSLRPFSMEERREYIDRFTKHPDMVELFPDRAERIALASGEFETRWTEALVTVRRLDGSRFFID